jgi:putative PIN family toxin of toxin-antitoxin system
VIDTNVVLDLCVFDDPTTAALREALDAGSLRWLTTKPMRDELERVLAYPQIRRRLDKSPHSAGDVLAYFDSTTQTSPAAPKAPLTCKDADDQKFIDLACAHRALLLSKDCAVLCMAQRLLRLGVVVRATP